LKYINILLILIIGIILTSCADKNQTVIKKVITPKEYQELYKKYKNLIPATKEEFQRVNKYALLAIENKTDKNIACETIKEIGTQINFSAQDSYRVFIANEVQGCRYTEDEKFDFKLTPAASFISKTMTRSIDKQRKADILTLIVKEYSQDALDGKLKDKYKLYDDRWVILSNYAMALAIIKHQQKNLSNYYLGLAEKIYLGLAEKIIKSIPLNKNRYYRYNLSTSKEKVYYHYKQRDILIKINLSKIARIHTQLK